MSKITLEFANYIEFYEFIRKTHEFIDAASNRQTLEEMIMSFKDDVVAKVEEVKSAISSAITTEIDQVKAVIDAKLVAAGVSDADKTDILASIDGIKNAAVSGIDSVSNSV